MFRSSLLGALVCASVFVLIACPPLAQAAIAKGENVLEFDPHLLNEDGGPNDVVSAIALERGPFVVEFYAPWCPHCQRFGPTYNRLADVFVGIASFYRVDCVEHRAVCRRAGVRGYPTIRAYDSLGKIRAFGPPHRRTIPTLAQFTLQSLPPRSLRVVPHEDPSDPAEISLNHFLVHSNNEPSSPPRVIFHGTSTDDPSGIAQRMAERFHGRLIVGWWSAEKHSSTADWRRCFESHTHRGGAVIIGEPSSTAPNHTLVPDGDDDHGLDHLPPPKHLTEGCASAQTKYFALQSSEEKEMVQILDRLVAPAALAFDGWMDVEDAQGGAAFGVVFEYPWVAVAVGLCALAAWMAGIAAFYAWKMQSPKPQKSRV